MKGGQAKKRAHTEKIPTAARVPNLAMKKTWRSEQRKTGRQNAELGKGVVGTGY